MDTFSDMVTHIIHDQEQVIGPLAWSEARKVKGLTISDSGSISFTSEQKEVLNALVSQYERLFGPASHDVCREAVAELIKEMPPAEIPSSLQ